MSSHSCQLNKMHLVFVEDIFVKNSNSTGESPTELSICMSVRSSVRRILKIAKLLLIKIATTDFLKNGRCWYILITGTNNAADTEFDKNGRHYSHFEVWTTPTEPQTKDKLISLLASACFD